MRTSIPWVIGLALLTVAVGCQKEAADDAASTKTPQAAPPSAPTSPPGGQPPHGGMNPHGAAAAQAEGGDPISGTVALGDEVDASAVSKSDILFIMARKSQGGGRAGGLVAVKKMGNLDAKSFPARFELSAGDAMMMGTPFAGPFIVYARLDKDGDPMTKTDEDLYATVPEPVENGTSDLKLNLEHGAPKTAPKPPAKSGAPASKPSGH